jgi:hypothetical protein
MIDAVELYGPEALDDPFREQFEGARALLDGPEWEQGLEKLEPLARAGSPLSPVCVASCMLNGWYDHEDLNVALTRWAQLGQRSQRCYARRREGALAYRQVTGLGSARPTIREVR